MGGVGVTTGLLLVGAGLLLAGVFLLTGLPFTLITAGFLLIVYAVAFVDVDAAAKPEPAPTSVAPGLTRVGR